MSHTYTYSRIHTRQVDSGPSILDKDKSASALLEMAGKKLYSKDIRETPEEN